MCLWVYCCSLASEKSWPSFLQIVLLPCSLFSHSETPTAHILDHLTLSQSHSMLSPIFSLCSTFVFQFGYFLPTSSLILSPSVSKLLISPLKEGFISDVILFISSIFSSSFYSFHFSAEIPYMSMKISLRKWAMLCSRPQAAANLHQQGSLSSLLSCKVRRLVENSLLVGAKFPCVWRSKLF